MLYLAKFDKLIVIIGGRNKTEWLLKKLYQ